MKDQICVVKVENGEVSVKVDADSSFITYAANVLCREVWEGVKDPELRKEVVIPATLCAILATQKLTGEEKIAILMDCVRMIAEVG